MDELKILGKKGPESSRAAAEELSAVTAAVAPDAQGCQMDNFYDTLSIYAIYEILPQADSQLLIDLSNMSNHERAPRFGRSSTFFLLPACRRRRRRRRRRSAGRTSGERFFRSKLEM
jgi:hypothetical protein